MTVEASELRAAMRQWVTGVTVVTTITDGGYAGMTVSSFTSVALEPATVLVCLNKHTYTHDAVQKSGVYAVSLLATGQDAISNRFAGVDSTLRDRFSGLSLTTAETGAPILIGAVAWLDCIVRATHDTVTHTLFMAEVVYAHVEPEQSPLVYHNRTYHTLPLALLAKL